MKAEQSNHGPPSTGVVNGQTSASRHPATKPVIVVRTASGKEKSLVDFYAQLRRDGLNVSELAKKARVDRAALTEILNGARNGRNTWKHVVPHLSPKALLLLQQCSAWNDFATEAATKMNSRRGARPAVK